MMALTAVAYIFFINALGHSAIFASGSNLIFIGAGIIGIYLFSAVMMSLKKHWAFFIGFGYMTLSTLWYTSNIIGASGDFILLIYLLIRYILIVYLAVCIRKVLFAMRLEPDNHLDGVIDNQI